MRRSWCMRGASTGWKTAWHIRQIACEPHGRWVQPEISLLEKNRPEGGTKLLTTFSTVLARTGTVIAEHVAQWAVGGLGDADALRCEDALRSESIVCDPQAAGSRGQIAAVVAGASDAESLGETAGTTGVSLGKSFIPRISMPRARAISSMPSIGSTARNSTPPGLPSGSQETLRQ